MSNRIALVFFLFCSSSIFLFSEEFEARIRSFIMPDSNRIINAGPCLLNDSIQFYFELHNSGTNALYMERLVPSFLLGHSPYDQAGFQFNLYKDRPLIPMTILPNESDTLILDFKAGDLVVSNLGWHHALLAMSFYNNNTKQIPPVTPIDTFFLKVKKTDKFFDNFDDVINFDSVYINPTNPEIRIWRGKNTFNREILLRESKLNYISQSQIKQEFNVDGEIDNIKIIPYGIISRNISYKPLVIGGDSAIITNYFAPNPISEPDKIDSSSVLLLGTGVKQELTIMSCNYDFRADSIFLGDLKNNSNVNIILKIKNTGNIPIYAISENIINLLDLEISEQFNLIKRFQYSEKYLLPNDTATIELEYIPQGNGLANYLYEINTNLGERKIYGFNESDKKLKFYLFSNVVSPKYSVINDSLNFGNIVLNRVECPARRDTTIRISNLGQNDLILYDVRVEPDFPKVPFRLIEYTQTIPPNEDGFIKLAFEATSDQVMDFDATIFIKTNEGYPSIEKEINLFAKTLPPISTELSIDRGLKTQPGSIIEVPLVLRYEGGNPVVFSNKFTTDIIYDRSLLEFIGINTLNTATEGTVNLSDTYENSDKPHISLNFQSSSNNYFIDKDTIVKLRFNTYLGERVSTEIAMSNSFFADNRCNNLFNIKLNNGIYTTDSVCGVELKAVQRPNSILSMKIFYNFGNNIKVNYKVPYNSNIKLSLYDNYGNKIREYIDRLYNQGTYEYYLDDKQLVTGIYFLRLSNDLYYCNEKIVIIK